MTQNSNAQRAQKNEPKMSTQCGVDSCSCSEIKHSKQNICLWVSFVTLLIYNVFEFRDKNRSQQQSITKD